VNNDEKRKENCNVDLILGNTAHNTVRYHKSIRSGTTNCSDNPKMRWLSDTKNLISAFSHARLTTH
jgi:hypothetical protein